MGRGGRASGGLLRKTREKGRKEISAEVFFFLWRGGEEQRDREKEVGQRRGFWLVFLGERSPVVAKAGQVFFFGIIIYSFYFFVGSLRFQFLLVLFSVSLTLLVELLCFL